MRKNIANILAGSIGGSLGLSGLKLFFKVVGEIVAENTVGTFEINFRMYGLVIVFNSYCIPDFESIIKGSWEKVKRILKVGKEGYELCIL